MTYQDMNQGKTNQRQAETGAENIAKMKFQIQYWYVFLFFFGMIISFVWLRSSRLFIQWLMTLHFVQRSFFCGEAKGF